MSNRDVNPKIENYLLLSIRDEFFALLNFLRHQWYLIPLVVGLFSLLIYYQNPFPPSHIRVAVGQENSTLEAVGRRYLPFLSRTGTTVEFVHTNGAIENLELLKAGKVDVALSQGGVSLDDAEGIVSAGSVGYQPLWFFCRADLAASGDVVDFLQNHRVSIALKGSGTRMVVDQLLALLPAEQHSRWRLREMSAGESIKALSNGEIDGMFLLAGLESGNVQALLARRDFRLLEFPLAEAISRHLDYAERVVLPAGTLSLRPTLPARDLSLIATTTTILVREDLHPAIQHAFLKAASAVNREEPGLIPRKEGFPAFVEKGVPRSRVAERFYKNGTLLFEDHLPFFLASFFDTASFWMALGLAVLYPLMKLFPQYRKTMFRIVLSDRYGQVFRLYRRAEGAADPAEQAAVRQEFDRLERDILALWIPKGGSETFSFLMSALQLLRNKVAQFPPANGALPPPSAPLPVRDPAQLSEPQA